MDWDLVEALNKELAGLPCQFRLRSNGHFAIEMVPCDPAIGWLIKTHADWLEIRERVLAAARRLLLKRIAGQVAKMARSPLRWCEDDMLAHRKDDLRGGDTVTREEAFAIYSAKSKAGAAVCNVAYAAASRAYDGEMAAARAARDRGEIDQKAVTALMLKAAGRHDRARQRADAEYASLMRQAHEDYMSALS